MSAKTLKVKETAVGNRNHMLDLLQKMILIRYFEDKCAELYQAQKIRGFMHLYNGEEAIAVGAISVLRPDDAIFATYREHGHALARGVDPGAIMAEMYGKLQGCCRGRGGSMHIFDAKTNLYGGNAIVAGHLPLAVGFALAYKKQGKDSISVCFFGDGAVPEGEFHESMNLAALLQVPVLFLCENNQYCMGSAIQYTNSNIDLWEKGASYHVPAERVDGMDVLAVEAAVRKAAEHIRSGKGPYFLEALTYRFRPHSMFDAELYRTKAEVEQWRKRDPIPAFISYLKKHGLVTDDDLDEIEKQAAAEVQEAVDFAEAGTWEPVEELTRFVYSERRQA